MICSHPVKLSPRIAEHEEHVEEVEHVDPEHEHEFHTESVTEVTEIDQKFDQTTVEAHKLLFGENSVDSSDFGSTKDKLLFSEKDISSEELATSEPESSTA